jgi:anti-anti-sigma factor
MEALEITQRDETLRLAGELDLRTAPMLNDALARIDGHGPVKLDLSELSFIDSSGLHAIVEYASTTNGNGPVVLEGLTGMMRRVFEITHLDKHPSIEIRPVDGG